MMLVIACGVGWRIVSPAGLKAEQTRLVLTTVVYYVFLPALILDVLWQADLGIQSLAFSLLGVSSIFVILTVIWLVAKLLKVGQAQTGAILLATAFPNVTYLGLPVLNQVYGSWAKSVVIQMDLFAFSPLLFTVGVLIARHYGENHSKHRGLFSFLTTPPFITAFIAVLLNVNQIAEPLWLSGVLKQMSAAVVPLMLFSLGLALSWHAVRFKNIPIIIPVSAIKLMLMPWFAMEMVGYLSLSEPNKAAAVLDLAMPSMLLGIVFCDKYKLDSSLYAMAVTVTTLLSMLTLPYWYGVL